MDGEGATGHKTASVIYPFNLSTVAYGWMNKIKLIYSIRRITNTVQ